MTQPITNDILISFFMFTTDLEPDNPDNTPVIAERMSQLLDLGYNGFDLPIAPGNTTDHAAELDSYKRFRDRLHGELPGLDDVKITTNVFPTRTFDPSSPFEQQRQTALAYLKSRVEITAALGGKVMAGPLVMPYGVFPTVDVTNAPLWSDTLQDWLKPRYENAKPVLAELADYAETLGVKVAIEPVCHWEIPGLNLVGETTDFVNAMNKQIGLCIDSAQVVLGSEGLSASQAVATRLLDEGRLHSVHISAPDRGAVHDSWIPWEPFLAPIRDRYEGPYLIEVFNAIPAFLNGLRLTRRIFPFSGSSSPSNGVPSAFDVARDAISTLRQKLSLS
jgi:sugar phosphate isomerase/epimerase